MIRWIVALALLGAGRNVKAANDVNFAKSMTASELAEHFFGPTSGPRDRQAMLNVGRIGISAKTKLNCGRIDAVASIDAEMKNIENQLTGARQQIVSMFSNPSGLAMAAICYYKPSVCSYIRHSSLLFGESLNLAFNACKSIDSFIDSEADKGMRNLQAESIQRCITDRSKNGAISTEDIRSCQGQNGQMRDLLQPYKTKYAGSKQKVLESVLGVVGENAEYDMLAKLLGEVEVYENGYWVKLFPRDLMSVKTLTDNLLAAGHDDACQTPKLESIIKGTEPLSNDPFAKAVRVVIKSKIPLSVIKDLKSIPTKDQATVCSALGDAVAVIATKNLHAKYQGVMAAALTNDALPDDLKTFYEKRTEVTLDAVMEKIEAEGIMPLALVLKNLRHLASLYRQKNQNEASGVSSMKVFNEKNEAAQSCEDELSCGN